MGHYLELDELAHPDFAVPNRKPVGAVEVDRTSSLSRGLAACLPFRHGFRDLVSGVAPEITGSPTIIADQKGSGDRAVDFGRESNQYYLKYNGILNPAASELTVLAGGHNWFDYNYGLNYINADSLFVSNRTSGNKGWSYGVDNAGYDTSARAQLVLQGVAEYKSTSAYLNGFDYNIHGCVAKSNSTVRFFENGIFQESKSIGAFTTGESNLWVGKQGNGGSPYGYEILTFLYVWERTLSDAEYIQLSRNPYQILKPAIPQTYFIPSAGGGVTVTPGNDTLSLTGYAPTVETNTTLTPSAGSFAYTGYAPSVETNITLEVGAGSVTYTAYAPTVETNVSLIPGAASLTYSGLAPSVSVANDVTLTPGTYTLTYSGYAPSILSTQLLTPSVGSVAYTGYSPSIFSGLINESSQSHTATVVKQSNLMVPIAATHKIGPTLNLRSK